jgi:putative transposase
MSTVAEIYFSDKDLKERWRQIPSDFWHDLKQQEAIAVKRLIETSMDIQIQDLIGSRRCAHNYSRPTYRNGSRMRKLITSFGYMSNIRVPRIRSGKITFHCLPYYKQRTPDIDRMILEMFLAGVATRRIAETIAPLLGPRMVSSSSVSRISKTLNTHVNQYHAKTLSDHYVYLLADAVYFNVKNPIWKKRRCILVLYGITTTGLRELIDFQIAPNGESENAWQHFLNRLYHRGLMGKCLRLVVTDGNKGLANAIRTIYPFAKHQLCWAHKLRNVSNKLPRKLQGACISQARDIYNASDYSSAFRTFKSWAKFWHPIAPEAVKCLTDDIDKLLHFFNEPKHLWKKLRTSNIIERCFREVRRRTRPMSCFQNSDSIQRIIFAVFFRLNKQWENKLLKLTHNS